jgi:hypothetical protein
VSEVLVFGSVAGATVAWAAAEWWRAAPRSAARARVAWTVGAALMLVHSVAAFALLYGGSHRTAVDATARQTAAVTGVATGAGIYVNYAFLAIWLADVLWCWAAPAAYATRSPVVSVSLRVFFLFMFLNGAVIFADGLMRVLGAVAVATAGAAWIRGARV